MQDKRKPTNLSLDAQLVATARARNVNLSRAAEAGIRTALRETAAQAWVAENRQALDSSNAVAEASGLPLRGFRAF